MGVKPSISHNRAEETLEAKARWFQSLPLVERLDVFCNWVDLALTVNPRLTEQGRAQPLAGRIQVVTKPAPPASPSRRRGNIGKPSPNAAQPQSNK
jgi:hypothetical protein